VFFESPSNFYRHFDPLRELQPIVVRTCLNHGNRENVAQEASGAMLAVTQPLQPAKGHRWEDPAGFALVSLRLGFPPRRD
jgi:hypothetical protein